MDKLLEELGLYQTEWIPYEKVIKLKSNDYTILIKHHNSDWEWNNKKYFDSIDKDIELKNKFKESLNINKNGKVEY